MVAGMLETGAGERRTLVSEGRHREHLRLRADRAPRSETRTIAAPRWSAEHDSADSGRPVIRLPDKRASYAKKFRRCRLDRARLRHPAERGKLQADGILTSKSM